MERVYVFNVVKTSQARVEIRARDLNEAEELLQETLEHEDVSFDEIGSESYLDEVESIG